MEKVINYLSQIAGYENFQIISFGNPDGFVGM